MEAPDIAAGEMWEDQSFTPEIAMKGTSKEIGDSERPIWKRPKVSFCLFLYHIISLYIMRFIQGIG